MGSKPKRAKRRRSRRVVRNTRKMKKKTLTKARVEGVSLVLSATAAFLRKTSFMHILRILAMLSSCPRAVYLEATRGRKRRKRAKNEDPCLKRLNLRSCDDS